MPEPAGHDENQTFCLAMAAVGANSDSRYPRPWIAVGYRTKNRPLSPRFLGHPRAEPALERLNRGREAMCTAGDVAPAYSQARAMRRPALPVRQPSGALTVGHEKLIGHQNRGPLPRHQTRFGRKRRQYIGPVPEPPLAGLVEHASPDQTDDNRLPAGCSNRSPGSRLICRIRNSLLSATTASPGPGIQGRVSDRHRTPATAYHK